MITECLMNLDDLYEKDWRKDQEKNTSIWNGRVVRLPKEKKEWNLFSLVKYEDRKEDQKKEKKPSATFNFEAKTDFERGKRTDVYSGGIVGKSDDGRVRGSFDAHYKKNEDGKSSKGVTARLEMDIFSSKK